MAGSASSPTVVIGGGIAGVLTAARLAAAGRDVVLIERDRIGAGATVTNHGMIHSGAMFAEHHPELVAQCQQAQQLVREAVPAAVLGTFDAVYYGQQPRTDAAERAWTMTGLRWSRPAHSLAADALAGRRAAVVQETIVSSRDLLVDLLARALAAGVEVLDAAPVTDLRRRESGGWTVTLGSGTTMEAATVVCAAGAANRALLAAASSVHAAAVRSRLEVMVALPSDAVSAPILCLDYGGPTIVPSAQGVLVSLHGAPRVDIDEPTRVVPIGRAGTILAAAAAAVPGLAEATDRAFAYSCVKTELRDGAADQWGSRPGAAVIDHSVEGLNGLWTLLPGKMTLAFHASATIACGVLGRPVTLAPPSQGTPEEVLRADTLVAMPPWLGLHAYEIGLQRSAGPVGVHDKRGTSGSTQPTTAVSVSAR